MPGQIEQNIIATTLTSNEALIADADAIEELFTPVDDESCVSMTCEEFEAIREDVASRSLLRDEMILDLIRSLEDIEEERAERASELLKSYGRLLTAIAYLSEPDVQRVMLGEANLVNSALLENQRAIAELRARLLTAEVVRDRNSFVHWKERKAVWVSMKSEEILSGFLEDTAASKVRQDEYVERLMQSLGQGAKQLLVRRSELMASAKKQVPALNANQLFDVTSQEWINTVHDLQAKIDDVQLRSYRRAADFVGDEHESQQAMLRQCQISLVKSGVCSAEDVTQIVEDGCGTTIRSQLGVLDVFLVDLEESFASQQNESATVLAFLSTRMQALSNVWGFWETQRDSLMKRLQDELSAARAVAAEVQNGMEAEIDKVVDSIRQAPSPEELKAAWVQVNDLMINLNDSYEGSRAGALGIVGKIDSNVMGLYRTYHANLCKALGVHVQAAGEDVPQDTPVITVQDQVFVFDPPEGESGGKGDTRDADDASDATRTEASEGQLGPVAEENSEFKASGTAEALDTDGSTPGKVTAAEGAASTPVDVKAAHGGSAAADTPNAAASEEGSDQQGLTLSDSEQLTASALTTIQANSIAAEMRFAWLDRLLSFQDECTTLGNNTTTHETGLIESEYSMQMHLHNSRLGRLKTDVHNVRAAEFALHRERVARHCAGMEDALQAEKQRFDAVCKQSETQASTVAQQMKELKSQVEGCKSVRALKNLMKDSESISESFKESTRSELRAQRQKIDEMLRRLRESNGTLRTSLRTFSEGGNFSTAEIEEYKTVLKFLGADIDEAEGNILKVLNGMEVSLVNVAEEGMLAITELYESHIKDVEFIGEVKEMLSTTQIQVRSRVATDNAEAAALDANVAALKTLVNANRLTGDVVKVAADLGQSLRTRLTSLACLLPTTLPEEPDDELLPTINSSGHTSRRSMAVTSSSAHPPKARAARTSGGKSRTPKPGRRNSRVPTRREGNAPVLEEWPEPPSLSFLKDVNTIRERCRTAICEKIATPYYDGLRGKTPTRADQIADVIQPFMEGIETQLNTMYDKATQYRKEAVLEFTDQVRVSVKLLTSLSKQVFISMSKESWSKLEKILDELCRKHDGDVIAWLAQGKEIEQSLRPSLGHPNNTAELEAKCTAEAARCDHFVVTVNEYYTLLGKQIGQEVSTWQCHSLKRTVSLLTFLPCLGCGKARREGSVRT